MTLDRKKFKTPRLTAKKISNNLFGQDGCFKHLPQALPVVMGSIPAGVGGILTGIGGIPARVGGIPAGVGSNSARVGGIPARVESIPAGVRGIPTGGGGIPTGGGGVPAGVGSISQELDRKIELMEVQPVGSHENVIWRWNARIGAIKRMRLNRKRL